MIDNHIEEHPDYGPAARYSEHKRGDIITYTSTDGKSTCTGAILWVQAPGLVAGRQQPVRYVVEPAPGGFPDIVWPSEVLTVASQEH